LPIKRFDHTKLDKNLLDILPFSEFEMDNNFNVLEMYEDINTYLAFE
jgi:hypothetical protein